MNTVQIKCHGHTTVPLSELRPFQGDLKSLSEGNYIRLRGLILGQGFSFPLFVWRSPENQTFILDGHQRLRVLERLRDEGFEVPDIPVAVVQAESYREAKEKLLSAASQFGRVESQGLYDFLSESEIDVGFATENYDFAGFDFSEFTEQYFADEPEPRTDFDELTEDEIPDVDDSNVVVKRGDRWRLGEHLLICGDSTDQSLLALGDEQFAMCFTSPPYNVGDGTVRHKLGDDNKSDSLYINKTDHRSESEYIDFLVAFTDIAIKLARVSFINIQMLSGNKIAFTEFVHHYRHHLKDMLIWNKESGPPAASPNTYNSAFEFVVALSDADKTNTSKAMPGQAFQGCFQNVFTLEKWRSKEACQKEHGAVFPVALPELFITRHTMPGERVYEPFGGTGTTLIACEKQNRRCVTVELEPRYCQIVIDRWELMTGKRAERINP